MSLKPLPERGFGVEIECLIPNKTHWQIADLLSKEKLAHRVTIGYADKINWCVSSESLGGVHGIEIKSPILSGEAGIADLQKVMRAVVRMGGYVNDACGMHVHMSRNDLTSEQMRNWAWGYMRFQKQIDKLVTPRRVGPTAYNKTNEWYLIHYFQVAPKSVMDRVRDCVRSDPPAQNHADVRSAVSPNEKGPTFSIRYIPTVELRQHQGTLNPARAGHWIRLMLWLSETAKEDARFLPAEIGEDEGSLRAFLRYTGAPELTRRYMLNQSRALRNAVKTDTLANFEVVKKPPVRKKQQVA